MTIPYADEIQRMWRRSKAVRAAYAEHMEHANGTATDCNGCIHCVNWRWARAVDRAPCATPETCNCEMCLRARWERKEER